LMLLPALAVMQDKAGPVVNFYEPGSASVPLPSGKSVRLQILGEYPQRGDVEILVEPETAESFTLSLRIPAWSQRTKIRVNGEGVVGIKPGAYERINRTWKPGDRVQMALDMSVREVCDPGGSDKIGLERGPVLLVLDKRIAQPAGIKAARIKADADGVVKAAEVRGGLPEGIRWAIDVPCVTADGKTVSLRMCAYASAGRTWSEDSALQVWLPQPLDL
jgi:uncharacterized protein